MTGLDWFCNFPVLYCGITPQLDNSVMSTVTFDTIVSFYIHLKITCAYLGTNQKVIEIPVLRSHSHESAKSGLFLSEMAVAVDNQYWFSCSIAVEVENQFWN